MSDKRVVILNAPANAGKDVGAEYLSEVDRVHHKEFKRALFDVAIAVAQIPKSVFFILYNNRKTKEQPSDLLFGRSPREHMIHTSEKLIKPVYGEDYFGIALANSLQEGLNVVSDGGFIDELQPVIEAVGKENVLIVRVHRDGCDFSADSRDYLYDTGCLEVDLENDSTLEDYLENLENLVNQWRTGLL